MPRGVPNKKVEQVVEGEQSTLDEPAIVDQVAMIEEDEAEAGVITDPLSPDPVVAPYIDTVEVENPDDVEYLGPRVHADCMGVGCDGCVRGLLQ